MASPPPGQYPSQTSGYTPTISSLTNGSSMRVTWYGTAPTCITGMSVPNPYTLGSGSPVDIPALTQSTTFQLIACKTNYAPSMVATQAYTIVP
jgi:hypothetical protein